MIGGKRIEKIPEDNSADDQSAEEHLQEYEGGSMQPMAESMKAVELTKERVYELKEYAK